MVKYDGKGHPKSTICRILETHIYDYGKSILQSRKRYPNDCEQKCYLIIGVPISEFFG